MRSGLLLKPKACLALAEDDHLLLPAKGHMRVDNGEWHAAWFAERHEHCVVGRVGELARKGLAKALIAERIPKYDTPNVVGDVLQILVHSPIGVLSQKPLDTAFQMGVDLLQKNHRILRNSAANGSANVLETFSLTLRRRQGRLVELLLTALL